MTTPNSEQNIATDTKAVLNENINIEKKIETEIAAKDASVNPDSGSNDTSEDPNWRAFREARKKDRLEREAAERKAAEKEAEVAALKAAMEAAFSKSAPTPQAYQQYYGINTDYEPREETEEQRLEKKLNELLEQREKRFYQEQMEREMREYPTRLRKELPDFANVCSQENLDYLDYHYPEISRPLQRLPEGYDKWSDIYHAVKKLIPNQSGARRDAQRMEVNAAMPKSISSTTPSYKGDAPKETWQQTEQRRAENWARMQRIMKSTG